MSSAVKVPTMKNTLDLGKDALIAGGLGGVMRALGAVLFGDLGAALGGITAGAMVGGTAGTVLAVTAVSDALVGLTAGIAGRFTGMIGGGNGSGSNMQIM